MHPKYIGARAYAVRRCRPDRLLGNYVGHFPGRLPLKAFTDNIKKWSGKKDKGPRIIIADYAEYTGTTGCYYIKHFCGYSRSFEGDRFAWHRTYTDAWANTPEVRA